MDANGIPTTVIVSARTMPSSVNIPLVRGRIRALHSPIGLPGEDVAPGIDLAQDDGDRGGRDDRREQAADTAEQHGEERRHRPVSAVERHQRRNAGEVKDHPLDRGGDEVDGNEDRARRGEGQEVLRVDARRRAENLTCLPPASERMRIRGRHVVAAAALSSPARPRTRSAMNGSGWISDQFKTVAPPVTAPQKKLPTLSPNAVPVGTSMLVLRSPAAHSIGADHCGFEAGPVGPLLMPLSF